MVVVNLNLKIKFNLYWD